MVVHTGPWWLLMTVKVNRTITGIVMSSIMTLSFQNMQLMVTMSSFSGSYYDLP